MVSLNNGNIKKSEQTLGISDAALEDADCVQSTTKDGEQYFMSGSKLAILMTGLCLALFLIGLDTAIVSTVCHSGVLVDNHSRLINNSGNTYDH